MNRPVFLCVGGDARQIYACEKLAENSKTFAYMLGGTPKGAIVLGSLGDMSCKADVLVLPMLMNVRHTPGGSILPCGLNSVPLEELIGRLSEGAVAVGGSPDEQTARLFESSGVPLYDYFKCRELVIKNCIPTAEGALMIAMQELATTVFGTRVLILGYGNVAKACARLFSAAGAKVSCCVRRCEAAAEAASEGFESFLTDALPQKIGSYELVINTVPALLLERTLLERLMPKALVIDLASKPGGVDLASAEELGVRCIHALGLPGKVAPVTAGRYIAEAVENIISYEIKPERGML